MPITNGDLISSISVSDIKTALGRSSKFTLTLENTSTSPGYNLNCVLTLPDGVSFNDSTIPYSKISYDGNHNQLIEFINIKDLYQSESYSFDITVNLDTQYRLNNSDIPFNTTISGLNIDCTLDSNPRGNIDGGNIQVTSSLTTTATGFIFFIEFIFPPVYLKGAGLSSLDTPTNPFDISLTLLNNTRSSSSIDNLTLNFANGIRYIDTNYSVSGPDSVALTNRTITPVGNGINYDSLNINNFTLSASSTNIISFQEAIWNQYATNGVVNSGDIIANGTSLSSNAYISGKSYFMYAYEAIEALELLLEKTCSSTTTDVDITNTFTINYKLGEYVGLNGIVLNDTLGDGLSLSNPSAISGSISSSSNGTTIVWDLGDLAANSADFITYDAITLSQYSNDLLIAAGDILTNTCSISWIDSTSGNTTSISSEVYLTIPVPTLTKTVYGYFDSNLTPLSIQNATKGDYIGFTLTYDASTIAAVQNNVEIFDYAPLSMTISELPVNLSYSDSSLNSITPEIVDYNGLVFNIGNLPGHSNFSISFMLPVTSFESNFNTNLGKTFIQNNNYATHSSRDLASISISLPNPSISNEISANTIPIDAAEYNSYYNYTVIITNEDITSQGYPTCNMYNSLLTLTLPSELTFYSSISGSVAPSVSTSNSTVSNGTIVSPTSYTLNINELNVNGSITITFQCLVSSKIIASNSYSVNASMSRGTTALNEPYENFPGSNLEATATITANNITLNKTLTPNTIKLYGGYLTTVTLTVPIGVIAYNITLDNQYISNNSSLITNVLLNNLTPPNGYTLNNNLLSLPISNYVDSTNNATTFILTFNDVSTTPIPPPNSEEMLNLPTTAYWGYASTNFNSFSTTVSTPLTITAPNLTIELYQSNSTQNYDYTSDILKAKRDDIILYKYVVTNIGNSPAYNITISDVLSNNINFINFNTSIGNYNPSNKTITCQYNQLNNGESIEIIFTSKVSNNAPITGDILTNMGSAIYSSISDSSTTFNITSNSVKLINNPILIKKLQKNLHVSPDFTVSPISIIKGQSISYMVTITNLTSYTITNITITDSFPNLLNFDSFEPFSYGTLSVNNNMVTANVETMNSQETISFIYNVSMNIDVLKGYSLNSTINYSIDYGTNTLTNHSNTLITDLYGTGRGYTIY